MLIVKCFNNLILCKVLFFISCSLLLLNLGDITDFQGVNVLEKAVLLIFSIFILFKGVNKQVFIVLFSMIFITAISASYNIYPDFSWEVYARGTIQFFIISFLLSSYPDYEIRSYCIKIFCYLPIFSVIIGIFYKFSLSRDMFIFEWASGMPRLRASLIPNFLAYLCMSSVYASIHSLIRYGKKYYIPLVISSIILLLTASRMAILLTTILALSSLFFSIRGQYKLKTLLIYLACFFSIIFMSLFGEVIISRITDSGLNGRDHLWEYMNDLASWYNIFGIGLGHQSVSIPESLSAITSTIAAHNEYLRLKLEIGLYPSLLFFFLFLVSGVLLSASLRCKLKLDILIVWLVFLVNCFVSNSFSSAYVFLSLFCVHIISLDDSNMFFKGKRYERTL